MADILDYIDKMQIMYGDKEPSSMVPEPRMEFNNGLSVDPLADSGRKIKEVLNAYKRYRRGEKNPKIKFNQFFEMWARENFETGGNVGGGADFSPQKIDDNFFIDHYRKVIDARLGAMEAVRKRGGSNNPNDVKYLFEQYNELKKHGGDVLEFDQRIKNLSPSAEAPEFAAQGGRIGQLVQPSDDGSRPGYKGEKKLITFKELVKLDLPYSEATLSNVFSSPDRNKNLKKLFKDNGFKVVSKGPRDTLLFNKPSAGQIDNLWQDTIKLVESGKATIPDKMRIPFKNEVLKVFNEFKKTDTPFTTSDIYYKVVENVGDNKRIFIPKKLKGDTRVPGESIKIALGKENSEFLLDGNIARIEKTTANRKKMFDLLLKGETDVPSLAKDLGISKKDVYAEANKLFDDSYRYNANLVRKTGAGSGYGYLKDYNQSDFNTVLKNLRKSGFEKLDERSARALIYNAYGDKNSVNYSPKKFDAALKKLSEYNKINTELRNTFGKGFQLDHTLSFKALKDLGNTTPENLIRFNPLPENINKMKIAFDRSYNNIITQLRDGNISPNISKNLLEKKKLIEDISTKTNIGSFKVDASGKKILSFGSQPFLKTDIPSQMLKNVDVQNRLVDVLKDYSDEDLKKITKKKSFESLKNLEKIPKKEINEQIKLFKKMGYRCNKSGGGEEDVACYLDDAKQTRADLKSSDINVRAKAITKQRNALNVAKKLPEIGKVLRRVGQGTLAGVTGTLKALGFTSPIGYAIEGVVEGGIYDYYRKKGYNHEQSLAETFTPGIVTGRPEGVPWYGGAEKLLEKELTEVREKPTVLEDGTIVPGKIIEGAISDPKILQYQQALEDQEQVYDAFSRKTQGLKLQRKDIRDEASADIQDLYRSRTINNINRIMDPESMASQAYNTALEKQAGAQDQRARDYKAENYAQTKPSDFMQEQKQKERNKAMLQMFPGYTPTDIQNIFKHYNMDDYKNYSAQDYKNMMSSFDTQDKMGYFADNFRLEKAGGGIAGLSGGDKSGRPPESGPASQGLRSLYKNGRKL